MGLFDKFLDAVRLNDDYDEDDDDFFDEDDDLDEEEAPKKPAAGRFFSKFGSKAKAEPEADDDFDDEPAPAPRKADPKPAAAAPASSSKYNAKPATGMKTTPTRTTSSRPSSSSQKVTPMRHGKGTMVSSSSGMEVCVIKPTRVEDYREIADTLLSGCTVVLNLEGIDVELAQRIIDFASGSCYAINGGLQKVSSYIFIMTPADVEISGDIQDLLSGAMPSMRTAF